MAISSGIVALDGSGSSGAVVARDDWRPLNGGEAGTVLTDEPEVLGSSVSVLEIGAGLLARGQEILFPLLAAPGRAGAARAESHEQHRLREFHMAVLELLHERHGLFPDAVGAADLVAHPPDRRSTALNPATGELMGLHVDSHQRLPFGERHRSMTLCAVNLGLAERYFCFVNLSVDSLLDLLELPEPPTSALELKNLFFSQFSDYPILRITLRPGDAYLCNTQNTLHDGATSNANVPDVSFLSMASFAGTIRKVVEAAA